MIGIATLGRESPLCAVIETLVRIGAAVPVSVAPNAPATADERTAR